MKKRHLLAESGGGNSSTADRKVEYTTDAVPRQQKRTLKPLISARAIRERQEYLSLHPDRNTGTLAAIRLILNATEGRVSR